MLMGMRVWNRAAAMAWLAASCLACRQTPEQMQLALRDAANSFYQEAQYCRAAEFYHKHYDASRSLDSLRRAAEIHRSTCPDPAAAVAEFEAVVSGDGTTARALDAELALYEIMELDDPTSGLSEIPKIVALAAALHSDEITKRYLEIQAVTFRRIHEPVRALTTIEDLVARFGAADLVPHLKLMASELCQLQGRPEVALGWLNASRDPTEDIGFERARLLEVLGKESEALKSLNAMPATPRRAQRLENLLQRMEVREPVGPKSQRKVRQPKHGKKRAKSQR